jgi:trk system potassium uptake protein
MTPLFRPVFFVNGVLLLILGSAMLIPLAVDVLEGHQDWRGFGLSTIITLFVGAMLYFTNRGGHEGVKLRQAFLITASSYFTIAFFGGLPFYFSHLDMTLADAFFETTSGITTTGSTVIVGLDRAPAGILLWRALMNLLGGIGIVVMALAILPMLRIGGMQLFRTESSDNSEKMLPRTPQIALTISAISLSLTVLCAFCFWVAGMGAFDALCHAMATIATGGFSTRDASIGAFDSLAIELVAIVFMIAGSLPLMLYFQVLRDSPIALLRNTQVRGFLAVIAAYTLLLTAWLVFKQNMDMGVALRHTLFATVTNISTTGFVTADYSAWTGFPVTLLFLLLCVGGCTGSTAGGIKIFRFQVLFQVVKAQLKQLVQPHGVFLPRYDGKPIPESVITSVIVFFLLYACSFMAFALLLSFYEADFLTAMSGAAQALGNVGPGLSAAIGPAGNFAHMEDGAKWILSFAMIMGRLELFTIIVLFTPFFWKR